MKNSKILALALSLSLLVTLAAGCGAPQNNAGETAGTIKIGVIAPLTGDVAVYGTAVKNAVDIYTDKFNKEGGADGHKIELVTYDDKGDPTEALNAYNRLVSKDGVSAIIGPVTSGPTFGVAETSAKDNIPCVTGTATHPDVTTYGKNFFRACFEDPFQGGAMAKFAANELKAKKAAIIFNISDAYSTGLKDAFSATAKDAGVTVVSSESYGKGDVDFKAQLTKIAAQNPDVLFIPDYYNTAYLICKQARDMGITATFLGVDGTDGVLAIEGADTSVFDGLYFANHYSADDTAQIVQDFRKAYEDKFGETPNALAALGYDAAMILYNGIAEASKNGAEIGPNAESYQAIIDAITATDLDCVTGHITFDENNNPIKECSLTLIENGAYKFYKKY